MQDIGPRNAIGHQQVHAEGGQRGVGVGELGRGPVGASIPARCAEAVHIDVHQALQVGHELVHVDAGTAIDLGRPFLGQHSDPHSGSVGACASALPNQCQPRPIRPPIGRETSGRAR